MLLAVLCDDFELEIADDERYRPEALCIQLFAFGCSSVLTQLDLRELRLAVVAYLQVLHGALNDQREPHRPKM